MHLCDSASNPARGLGAIYDPACLRDPARASGPGHRDYSARLRDPASDPARGMGATYDSVSLRDSAKASGPGCLNYSESLSDLTQGFRVVVTESGSSTIATSGWLEAGTLRGSEQ